MVVIVRVRDPVEVIVQVAAIVFYALGLLQNGASFVSLSFEALEPLSKRPSKHLAP